MINRADIQKWSYALLLCALSLSAALLCIALLCGCSGGTTVVIPSPAVSPSPIATLPPIENALPTDENGLPDDAAARNAQSAQLEQAQTLARAAKRISAVADAVAVVTDDGRCLVAVKLRPTAKLDNSLKKKLALSLTRGHVLRITDDGDAYVKVAALQQSMSTGKSVSYTEIKAEWDKIRIAQE